MRKHLSTIILVIVLIVGVMILLYPTVSDYWNSFHQSRAIASYLEEIENRQNMPTLSLEKAYSIKAWDRITTEYGEGHIVKGFMRHRVKGGIMVDVEGFPAFLPGSQLPGLSVRA